MLALEFVIGFLYIAHAFFSGGLETLVAEINEMLQELVKNPSPVTEQTEDILNPSNWPGLAMGLGFGIFAIGVLAPLVEEFVFRLVPIGFATLIFGTLRFAKPLIIVVALLSGLVFGIIHLNNEGATVQSVIVFQCIGGVLYGLLFVKTSGMETRGVWRAYRTTVLTHALWNLVMVPLLFITTVLAFSPFVMTKLVIPPELLK